MAAVHQISVIYQIFQFKHERYMKIEAATATFQLFSKWWPFKMWETYFVRWVSDEWSLTGPLSNNWHHLFCKMPTIVRFEILCWSLTVILFTIGFGTFHLVYFVWYLIFMLQYVSISNSITTGDLWKYDIKRDDIKSTHGVRQSHFVLKQRSQIIYAATIFQILNIEYIVHTIYDIENNKAISNKRSMTFDVQQKIYLNCEFIHRYINVYGIIY